MAQQDYLAAILQSLAGAQAGGSKGMAAGMAATAAQDKLMTEQEFLKEKERRDFMDKSILGSTAIGGGALPTEQLISARETGDVSGLEYGQKQYAPSGAFKEWTDAGALEGTGMSLIDYTQNVYRGRYKPKYLTEREDSIKSADIFLGGIEKSAKERPNDPIPTKEEIGQEMLLRGINMNIPEVNKMLNSIRITQPTPESAKYGFWYRKVTPGKGGAVSRSQEQKKAALQTKAEDWLKRNGAPITGANIEAVIKQGKVR